MVQTTSSVAMACADLDLTFDTDCSGSWFGINGTAQSLSGTEQTRLSGEAYTFTGDAAVIQGGKKEPMELVVEIVYSETDGEAFEAVRGRFEAAGCGAHLCMRWSPAGGAVGDLRFTTGYSTLVSFTYPPIDASAGGPILAGFTLKVPEITTTTITS